MRPDSSRRAAVASLPSLLAISAAFFLPFVKGCNAMVSPLQFSLEGLDNPLVQAWLLPRFAVAALLAVLTLISIAKKREPGRACERLAWAALATSAAALAVDWYLLFKGDHALTVPLAVLSAITLGSVLLLLGAARHRSWARWVRLIAAHAALSSPLCGFVVTAGSWRSVGAGGYAYTTSIAILLFLYVLSRRRSG
jgi:peptidoglycan/LPS O-acetylase OafA/YrhL